MNFQCPMKIGLSYETSLNDSGREYKEGGLNGDVNIMLYCFSSCGVWVLCFWFLPSILAAGI